MFGRRYFGGRVFGARYWGDGGAVVYTYTLAAASGAFALSGQDAALTAQRKLVAVSGSFALTGQNVTFTYTPLAVPLTNAQMQQLYLWVQDLYGRQLLTVGTFIALK